MRRWAWFGAMVAGLIVPTAAGAAKATASVQGLTISPAILQVTLGATQPRASYDLSLTNHTSSVQNLHLSLVDFGTLDETGGLFLIGQPNDFERKYGLVAWMSLGQPTLSLQPGQTAIEPVTITNERSLTSGGHYGAVLIKTDPNSSAEGQSQVTFKPVITELLFLNKTGGDIFSLNVKDFQKPGGWGGLPSKLQLRFQDTGNVHVVPRGLVTITDPTGREVARGIINEDSDIVLPGAIRQVEVAMRSERSIITPGRYNLVIDYRYDGQDGTTRVAYAFYFINGPLLVSWLIGIVVGVGLIVLAVRKLRQLHRSGRLRELHVQARGELRRCKATLRRRRK